MATVVNKEAPYSGLANLMAMRGRMGDTELVHMSKPEIKGLASLGELTINPDTGLPEAFKLKSILPTVAGIGAAFATGGTSLLIPALATGLTSAVVNKDIGRGLFDGLLSYAGGSIMRGLSGGGEAFGELATQTAPAAVAPTAGQSVGQAAQNFTASQLTDIAGGFAPAGLSGELVAGQAAEAALSPGLAALPSSGATIMPPVFTATKDITPSFVGRQLGYETIKQGATLTPMQVAQLGGGTAGLTTSQMAGLYAPQAAVGVGGAMLQDAMTPEYPQPELLSGTVSTPRTPRTITRTPLRSTPVTEEEALGAALGTGPALRFSDYTTRYSNQGGLVGFATGGGIPAIKEAGDPSNDPQANVGTGVVGNVNVTDPVDIGLGAFNPSPLGLGLGLAGLAMGVPGLGLAASMMGTPTVNVNSLGQTQVSGVGNQSVDSFGNVVGTTQADIASMSAAPATSGVTPGLQDPMGVFGDFTSSGDGVSADSGMGGMSSVDGSEEGAAGGFENGGLIAMLQRGGFLAALAEGGQVPGALGDLPPHVARGLMENPEIGTDGAAFMNLVNSQPSTKDLMGGQVLDALGSLPPHVARGLMENPEIFTDAVAFMNLVNRQPSTKDLMGGGRPYFEGMVPGTAHGMKDNVAFKVQGGNIDTAMLSPGEYVVPADVVAMLGNGNGDSGAKELDAFAKGVRQKAFGTEKQQKQINAPKELGQLATA